MADGIKPQCTNLRQQIGVLAATAKDLAEECKTRLLDVPPANPPPDKGEMIANAMLAFRHLEDARMRIGKVIQAYDGGVSCYGS